MGEEEGWVVAEGVASVVRVGRVVGVAGVVGESYFIHATSRKSNNLH